MVVAHLVPEEGAGIWPALSRAVEGKSAALFVLLAGMAWGLQRERHHGTPAFASYVWRRATALIVLGLAVHVAVWPTEVLIPMGLMLALTMAVQGGGRRSVLAALLALVLLSPLVAHVGAGWFDHDLLDDGGHRADLEVGWASVRYAVMDGHYPLIPWLGYALLGVLALESGTPFGVRPLAWVGGGVASAFRGWSCSAWGARHVEALGRHARHLELTWLPTTLPFALLAGGVAVSVAAGCVALTMPAPPGAEPAAPSLGKRALLSLLRWTGALGKASLTHYLGHILLIVVPLRTAWPDEDWPVQVGVPAALGYLVVAMLASSWWFARYRRGPLEALMTRVSGEPGA